MEYLTIIGIGLVVLLFVIVLATLAGNDEPYDRMY